MVTSESAAVKGATLIVRQKPTKSELALRSESLEVRHSSNRLLVQCTRTNVRTTASAFIHTSYGKKISVNKHCAIGRTNACKAD